MAVVLALAVVGCQKPDEIQTYQTPKSADSPNPNAPRVEAPLPEASATGEFRIFGAMFPADQPEWFFRVVGPADKLEPHKEKFLKLVSSVRFPNGLSKDPAFDVPEGWKLGGGRPGQTIGGIMIAGPVETVLIDGDKTLEITVTPALGDPFQNLRRWHVDLLGNKDLARADLPNLTKPIETQKVKGLFADLKGPKNPAARRMMGGR
jgi:hypothetical protein